MKIWLKRYKLPLMCLRWMLTYLVVLFIAKYSRIYDTGMIPRDLFSTAIVGILVLYRFLAFFGVPVTMVMWIGGIIPACRQAGAQ